MHVKPITTRFTFTRDLGMLQKALSKCIDTVGTANQMRGVHDHNDVLPGIRN